MPGAVAAAVGAGVAATVAGMTIVGTTIVISTTMAAVIGAVVAVGIGMAMSAAFGLNKGPKIPDFGGSAALNRNSNRTISVNQPIAAHRIIYGKTRVGGIITFMHTTDDDSKLHQLITIAGHEVNSVDQYWVGDEVATLSGNTVSNTKFDGFIDLYTGTGSTAGDSAMHSALKTNTSDKWTTSHLQTGRAKIYIRYTHDQDAFAGGLPNITARVQGRKVYDPRDSTTAYSNNAALCIRDYLTNTEFGLGEPASRINDTAFQTAANICDENVSLSAGGTENRYECNGIFETTQTPKEIIGQLLSSCAGRLTYQGGQWTLYAGAYVAPTITLDESDLEGGLVITTQVGRRNLFNLARGVYVEPGNLYQPTDAPVIKNATYLAEDQDETIARDFDWGFTTSSAMAQRLAKIELEKVRQQITVQMPVTLKNGMRLQAGDTVWVTNTRMGWTAKPFLIEEWAFAQRGTQDEPTLGVDLVLRETASTVYTWSSGEETEVDPAPDTDLPNPFTVSQPVDIQVTEELYYTSTSSGVKVRALLSWTNQETYSNEFEVWYKASADSDYIFSSVTKTASAGVDDLAAGDYDFRVRTINVLGVRSSWSYELNATLAGLTTPPDDLTGFSVRALDGSAYLSWDAVTDLDVIHGGYIRIRHSGLISGATWNSGVDIGKKLGGGVTDVVLPLITGTYLAKAVDSTDNFSTNAVASITTVKNVTLFNAVTSQQEHGAFPGTKNDMVVSGSVLRLDGAPNLVLTEASDNIVTEAGEQLETEVSQTGLVETYGTYDFNNVIDLGQIFTSRVYSEFEVSSFVVGDLIDNRVNNIDDWANFDGEPSDKATATLQVRTTDDDPAGTPTWTAWQTLLVGDYKARALDFRVVAESTDSQYNIDISKLKAVVDMPDRVERGHDISSGAGAKVITYSNAYYATPTVGITANDLYDGHFAITSSSGTGFTVTFYSGSGTGTPVDTTFNYQAIGY
jgi:hypothetical protein